MFTLFLLYKFGDFPCFLTMFCIMVQSFFQLIGRRPMHDINCLMLHTLTTRKKLVLVFNDGWLNSTKLGHFTTFLIEWTAPTEGCYEIRKLAMQLMSI